MSEQIIGISYRIDGKRIYTSDFKKIHDGFFHINACHWCKNKIKTQKFKTVQNMKKLVLPCDLK